MTGKDGQYLPPKAWARERFATKLFDTIIGWIIIVVMGGALMLVSEGFRTKAEAVWNTPEKMEEVVSLARQNAARLDNLDKRVSVLSYPDVIFEVSAQNSGPIEGYCVEGEPCEMRLRVRRLESALACRIVPGSVLWGFVNSNDTFVAARRLDQPANRNLGAEWQFTDLIVQTPTGLTPEANFHFEAQYTDCPGMSPDDEPITRESPGIRVRVLDERP